MDSESLKKALLSGKPILLTSHVDPDGDGLGAILGLCSVLESLAVQARVVLSGAFPEKYQFLPGAAKVTTGIPAGLPKNKGTILLTADSANLSRLGFSDAELQALDPFVVNIDHHTSNEGFGDLVYFDPLSAASCELVHAFLKEAGWKPSKEAATALYNGILTDTGRFRFSNTRAETFAAASDLLACGADHNLVIRKLYDEKPYPKLLLEARVLQSLSRSEKIAWMSCTLEDMRLAQTEDTEEIVNKMSEIKGLEIAAFFKEVNASMTKISLRSVNEIDVNQIAGLFGGGGHAKAAGAKLKYGLEETRKLVLAACEKAVNP